MSVGASAEVNNADIAIFEEHERTTEVDVEEKKVDIQQQEGESSSTSATQSNLADSFLAAFGMEVGAGGGTGEAGPGTNTASSGGTMAVGMSTISTTSANQVTPPFTPYSYQK